MSKNITTFNSQFSIFNSQFPMSPPVPQSTPSTNSQFSIFNFQFSIPNVPSRPHQPHPPILNSQFSILNSQFPMSPPVPINPIHQFSIFNFQFSILNSPQPPSQSPTSKKSQKKFSSQPLLFRIFASNIANGDGFARPTTRLRNT